MVRGFVAREIVPHAAEWDRQRHVPVAVLRELGRLGLMGMCVRPEWGGSGADHVSYVMAVEALAAGDCGICNMMSVNNAPNCAALQDHGSDDQKRRFLEPLATGANHSAFLLTEPQAGSDAAALQTTAERRGDHYVLNGVKQFVTAGRTAGVALIVAVTEPTAGRHGMTCFLSPTDVAGYQVVREEEKLGHRTADTCQIALEDLEVPLENRLGPEGAGYRIALSYLEMGRIGVAAQAAGVAGAAFEAAASYARQRESFGRPIIEHQGVGFMLADMAADIEAARQLTLHAAALQDAGRSCLKEASMAKLKATDMAEQVCSGAIQVLGGYGYLTDFPVEKYWRDARVLSIYEGTNEIQRLVIARALANDS